MPSLFARCDRWLTRRAEQQQTDARNALVQGRPPTECLSLLSDMIRLRRLRREPRGLLICPLFACQTYKGVAQDCPAHCTNTTCPGRKKGAPLLPWLHENMAVVRGLLETHPPPLPAQQRLLLVTTSFPGEQQLLRLRHVADSLAGESNILWIVVEDAAAPTAAAADALRDTRIPHVHLAHGPTRRGGNAQRNVALKYIRDQGLEGVAYNLDDDNAYHPRLWSALRALGQRRVGVLAVRRGVFPPPRCDGRFLPLLTGEKRTLKIERPVYDNATGAFVRFDAGWCGEKSWMARRYGRRTFCVDMAGFAFDASLLRSLRGELWTYTGHGGESEFIERLLPGGRPDDLQPLANCGRDVLVFHNEWRVAPVAMVEPSAKC
jgi:hypothetical protein